MLVISRLSTVRTVSATSRIDERRLVEPRGAVDDHEVVLAAEGLEHALHDRRRDELGHLRRRRGEEDPHAGRMVDDERVERLRLAGFELRHQVRDRLVLRVQVEEDADVAELERGVDEDDRLAELRRGGDRHVDRDRGPADAALRAEDRDDLAVAVAAAAGRAGGAARGHDRGRRPAVGLLDLPGVDLPDRGRQLVAAEGLDEELARAGEHRAAEVVRLALHRHHHDGGVRDLGAHPLGCRDAVHVRHVDVHQHDVRAGAGPPAPAPRAPDAAAPTTSMSLSKPRSFVR